MQASLRSVRIAPKKAQLVAKMIRGKRVPDAVEILEHTNKKAARLLETLLKSAMANASHNNSQNAQMLVIKSLTVNKAQAYHRGVPMARGRVRPMRKFLSHIDMQLGWDDETSQDAKDAKGKNTDSAKKTSQAPKKTVQKGTTSAKKSTTSTKGKSVSKETASPTSKSSASDKTSESSN